MYYNRYRRSAYRPRSRFRYGYRRRRSHRRGGWY